MRAVAVELDDDIARLASGAEEDARELPVDNQRRFVVASGSRLRQIVEQHRGVERPAREIGSPAAFGATRDGPLEIVFAERHLLQLDLLQLVIGGTEQRRQTQIDPASLDRRIADRAETLAGEIERELAGCGHARRLRPVELGYAQRRLGKIEPD